MNNSQREEDFSTRSRGEGQRYVSVLCLCRNGSSLNYFGLVEGFSDQNIIDQTNFGGIFSNFFSFTFSYNQQQIYRPYGCFLIQIFPISFQASKFSPNQSSHSNFAASALCNSQLAVYAACFTMRIICSQCSSS